MKKSILKSFILCLAALLMLFPMPTGCGGADFSVEGEADAVKVYTYPANNIVGLKKLAVFGDYVIAVFDIDRCDAGHAPLNNSADGSDLNTYILAEDVPYALPAAFTLETGRGCYILRLELDRSTAQAQKIRLPEQPFVISGLCYSCADIEWSDECTNIRCTIWGGECSRSYYQTYDAGRGKWLEAEEEFKTYAFGPGQ